MSNFKFRVILIPIIVVLLVVSIVATVAAAMFADILDDFVGRGERHSIIPEGRENWDTEYYEDLYGNNTESKTASYVLARKVQEEGTVLLKNNGALPLAAGSTVTPFGYEYLNPIYGQVSSSGSAKWTIAPTTIEEGLADTYKLNNAAVDKVKAAGTPAALTEAEGTTSAGSTNSAMGGDSKIYEFGASIYAGIETQIGGTNALIVLTRAGQEGSDKKYDGYTDGTPHYLALTENEKSTIAFAKRNCEKVVVVIASSAVMQIPELMGGEYEADAILHVGHVGEKGFAALGDILSGKVIPSGRTVDIWATDFTKDPVYRNFGEMTYNNAVFTQKPYGDPSSAVGDGTYYRYFIEYEEDVYLGYRYYETADVMDDGFVYGELDGKGAVKTAGVVAYPFGYGLSYTKFTQSVKSFSDSGENITVTVKVDNTGEYDGKDVVQIYYSAPYTVFDKERKIEKPAKNLIAFAKTPTIPKGQSKDVTLTFAKEDMASYSYIYEKDGIKGAYVLEEGDYTITLGKNSHEAIESKTYHNGSTVWYDNDNPRKSEKDAQSALDNDGKPLGYPAGKAESFKAATNRFQDSSDYMNRDAAILSRADWQSSFPSRPENNKAAASDEAKALFGIEETFDPLTDKKLGNVAGSAVYNNEAPVSKEDNGLVLSDLRGKSYYDEAWQDWLDQIDYTKDLPQILEMMTVANYTTTAIDSLGLPLTLHADGANGIKAVKTDAGMDLTATYGYAPLMAATWNVELIEEVGNMFGKEAMENKISGWYSPAINLHRSPFSGRNFEYYSEDPVLTGRIAAAAVSGAGNAGLYCYIKHFAVNDQETHREFLLHTWATEQAMRELYFKAFEIPFKEAMMTIKYTADENGTLATKTMRAATAVMTAQNDIGAVIAHGNYALITEMLRGEWGFNGIVTSDMYVWGGDKSMFDLSFRAGCDTFLTMSVFAGLEDKTSPTMQNIMRRAIHNVGYTVAHSALMQSNPPGTIFYYDISPWTIWLIIADIVIGLAVIGLIVWIILRTLSERKYPDKYAKKNA